MNNLDITKARAYYYEFFSIPFFFYKNDEKFKIWQEQLEYLSQNPLNQECDDAFKRLKEFSFEKYLEEQNAVFYDMSNSNVEQNASFYEEGRDDGATRLRVIKLLKKSQYHRDFERCKDSEDFTGFILLCMATFLNDEIKKESQDNELSSELFESVINIYIDEFLQMVIKHKKADFFYNLATLMTAFLTLERSILGVQAPIRKENEQTPAQIALSKKPFTAKKPTQKSKTMWDEFTAL